MNNNNFRDSEYAHHGTGYQINAAGGTVNNTVYHGIRRTPIQVQDCWKSLAFEEMEKRFHDIDAAQTGTCEWLSRHERYRDWVEKKRGLLWIKGKPGSGKSTLLRYALKKEKERIHIAEKPLILSFFFHGRGTELQRTPLGLYRSLLHQLSKIPDAVSGVVDTFKERCETVGEVGEKWQWHPKELREFFESSILEALKRRPLYLFVDALDEYGEEDAKDLAQRFNDLLDSLQSTAQKPFHICFTCRPYPIVALKSVFEIYMESGNGADISNFVRHQLSEIEPTILPTIRDLITNRANGVFLWASLMVKRVSSLNLKATKLEQMKAAILPVPQELDALYLELTEEMGSDSLRLIQCICVAMEPLSIDALQWAMVIKTKPPYSSLQECQSSPHYQPDDESMKRQIQTLSHGLAEVTSDKTVQFIHQTVKDFFVEKGLLKLKRPKSVPPGTSESDYAVGMAHDEMSKICVRCVAMEEKAYVDFGYAIPLSQYAVERWVAHVQQSEQRGISQDHLLDCFAWPSQTVLRLWMRCWNRINDRESRFPGGTCLSHVASIYGLTGLFQAMLSRTSRTEDIINEKDRRGETPLVWAAENRLEAMARFLLDNGANANSKFIRWCKMKTLLLYAAEKGYEDIVKLLLERGADVNACEMGVLVARNRKGQTSLMMAARTGHEAMVRVLLGHGADMEAHDERGRTALLYAIGWSGHEDIIRLLLEHGADISAGDDFGMTPLEYAVGSGHNGAAQLLLERGAACDINVKDCWGRTPLSFAVWIGYGSRVPLLLKHGADIHTEDGLGKTPLSIAAGRGDESILQLLLEHGAASDINVKDSQGRTPLLLAADKGDQSIMQLLFEYGDGRNA